MSRQFARHSTLLALALVVAAGSAAVAQTTAVVNPGRGTILSTGVPQRDTLLHITKPLTANFQDQRLEDVVKFIAEVTGADLEPMWLDDRNPVGLSKDTPITLNVQNKSGLSTLERILELATDSGAGPGGNSWQMSDSGALQFGPKERLNKFKRVELYAINDLLLEIPRYNNAPEFDISQALQSSGGGGGGGGSSSPFQSSGGGNDTPRRTPEEKANEIIQILTTLVEPEQWQDNGGDGGSIRFFQGTLIVQAPDYMHRAINGYPYWSARSTKVAMSKGRRYVTLDGTYGSSQLLDIRNQETTATAGGSTGGGGQPPRPPVPPGG